MFERFKIKIIPIVIGLTISVSAMEKNLEKATLGGGCFWCTEAVYLEFKGVVGVKPGYSGGHIKNPTYEDVCTGTTGHAEVVEILYDADVVTFSDILEVFFMTHDPTTLNRQGNDVGPQYRSVVYYHSEEQKQVAEKIIQLFEKEKVYDKPIVTKVEPYTTFYEAENYHQNYYNRNKSQGYCQYIITPKLEKFRKIFKDQLKDKK